MAIDKAHDEIQQKKFPTDFWKSYTLDELAEMQNVKPITGIHSLMGSWPGEIDDGFEEWVTEMRHQNLVGDGSN